jgi:hypothetical protein
MNKEPEIIGFRTDDKTFGFDDVFSRLFHPIEYIPREHGVKGDCFAVTDNRDSKLPWR